MVGKGDSSGGDLLDGADVTEQQILNKYTQQNQ